MWQFFNANMDRIATFPFECIKFLRSLFLLHKRKLIFESQSQSLLVNRNWSIQKTFYNSQVTYVGNLNTCLRLYSTW